MKDEQSNFLMRSFEKRNILASCPWMTSVLREYKSNRIIVMRTEYITYTWNRPKELFLYALNHITKRNAWKISENQSIS